jgi:hypothetical protein
VFAVRLCGTLLSSLDGDALCVSLLYDCMPVCTCLVVVMVVGFVVVVTMGGLPDLTRACWSPLLTVSAHLSPDDGARQRRCPTPTSARNSA